MSTGTIRLLIADDHSLARLGLKFALEVQSDCKVIGEAGRGEEAVELYRALQPDVALIDLRLPGIDGIQATRQICAEFPAARVIVISTFKGEDDILRALQAGAKTYLLKSLPREEVLQAIRAAMKGESELPPLVSSILANRLRRPELTPRELEVIKLIVQGRSNKEIAQELGVELTTVKLHVGNVLSKLNANDRTDAATIAIKRGLVWID